MSTVLCQAAFLCSHMNNEKKFHVALLPSPSGSSFKHIILYPNFGAHCEQISLLSWPTLTFSSNITSLSNLILILVKKKADYFAYLHINFLCLWPTTILSAKIYNNNRFVRIYSPPYGDQNVFGKCTYMYVFMCLCVCGRERLKIKYRKLQILSNKTANVPILILSGILTWENFQGK